MDFNEEQKKALSAWIAEGCTLSDLQRKLREQFSLSLTYMDLRLALIDLGLTVQERPAKPETPAMPPPSPPPPPSGATRKERGRGLFGALSKEKEPAPAGVTLELDRVMRPGSLVSGQVTFSDGVTAHWSLDQLGRLALDAGRPGYRPSDEDVQDFQEALQRALEKHGF